MAADASFRFKRHQLAGMEDASGTCKGLPTFAKQIVDCSQVIQLKIDGVSTASRCNGFVLGFLALAAAGGATALLIYGHGPSHLEYFVPGIIVGALTLGFTLWLGILLLRASRQKEELKANLESQRNERIDLRIMLAELLNAQAEQIQSVMKKLTGTRRCKLIEAVLGDYLGQDKPKLRTKQKNVLDAFVAYPNELITQINAGDRIRALGLLKSIKPENMTDPILKALYTKIGAPTNQAEAILLNMYPETLYLSDPTHIFAVLIQLDVNDIEWEKINKALAMKLLEVAPVNQNLEIITLLFWKLEAPFTQKEENLFVRHPQALIHLIDQDNCQFYVAYPRIMLALINVGDRKLAIALLKKIAPEALTDVYLDALFEKIGIPQNQKEEELLAKYPKALLRMKQADAATKLKYTALKQIDPDQEMDLMKGLRAPISPDEACIVLRHPKSIEVRIAENDGRVFALALLEHAAEIKDESLLQKLVDKVGAPADDREAALLLRYPQTLVSLITVKNYALFKAYPKILAVRINAGDRKFALDLLKATRAGDLSNDLQSVLLAKIGAPESTREGTIFASRSDLFELFSPTMAKAVLKYAGSDQSDTLEKLMQAPTTPEEAAILIRHPRALQTRVARGESRALAFAVFRHVQPDLKSNILNTLWTQVGVPRTVDESAIFITHHRITSREKAVELLQNTPKEALTPALLNALFAKIGMPHSPMEANLLCEYPEAIAKRLTEQRGAAYALAILRQASSDQKLAVLDTLMTAAGVPMTQEEANVVALHPQALIRHIKVKGAVYALAFLQLKDLPIVLQATPVPIDEAGYTLFAGYPAVVARLALNNFRVFNPKIIQSIFQKMNTVQKTEFLKQMADALQSAGNQKEIVVTVTPLLSELITVELMTEAIKNPSQELTNLLVQIGRWPNQVALPIFSDFGRHPFTREPSLMTPLYNNMVQVAQQAFVECATQAIIASPGAAKMFTALINSMAVESKLWTEPLCTIMANVPQIIAIAMTEVTQAGYLKGEIIVARMSPAQRSVYGLDYMKAFVAKRTPEYVAIAVTDGLRRFVKNPTLIPGSWELAYLNAYPVKFIELVLKNEQLGSDVERGRLALNLLELMGESAEWIINNMDQGSMGYPYYNLLTNLLVIEAHATPSSTETRQRLMARFCYAPDEEELKIQTTRSKWVMGDDNTWALKRQDATWINFMQRAAQEQSSVWKKAKRVSK